MSCMGAYLHWRWYSLLMAALNLPFLIMLLLIPETPVHLISTGQIEQAHRVRIKRANKCLRPCKKAFIVQYCSVWQVLRTIRGPRWDVAKELTDLKCAREMGNNDDQGAAAEGGGNGRRGQSSTLTAVAAAAKPLAVSLGLMSFFQFTGIGVILGYTVDIFK
jgi:facilitated trehalose transporter